VSRCRVCSQRFGSRGPGGSRYESWLTKEPKATSIKIMLTLACERAHSKNVDGGSKATTMGCKEAENGAGPCLEMIALGY
jgi:hypothetical protein